MTGKLPFNVVQGAGLFWLFTAPLLWLGSALSKMDTVERYNIQLAVFTVVCLLGASAAIGACAGHRWARLMLIILSWAAAAFWLDSGYRLYRSQASEPSLMDAVPVAIGIWYLGMAIVLHFTEQQPSQDSLDGA